MKQMKATNINSGSFLENKIREVAGLSRYFSSSKFFGDRLAKPSGNFTKENKKNSKSLAAGEGIT